MLVLTRRPGERIRIGDDIEIVVVSVRGEQVRLGLAAPRGVSIYRGELIEQVAQENLAAAESAVRVESATPSSPARLPDPPLKSAIRDSETDNGAHSSGGPTGPPSLTRTQARPERRHRRAHG
jgi:carbon storage regulator